ncbi:MAG: HlyD family efflux transporter periplasmic adaptor subunit [Bacteroidota bacterium]
MLFTQSSFPLRLVVIAFLPLLVIGCGEEAASGSQTTPHQARSEKSIEFKRFKTVTVSPESKRRKVTVNGRLQPLEQIEIVSEVQGSVLPMKKLLKEGVRYTKGETLMRIDSKQYGLNLKAQKSQFMASLVRIMSQIKLDYPEEHPAWDTYLREFDAGVSLPPLPEVDNKQLTYLLSANNIFATFYSIKSAEELYTKYTLRAPFSGVITRGQVSQGAIVNPGVSLATLSRSDVFELKAALSSAFIELFKVGQKIQLTHSNTGESWEGRVSRLGGSLEATSQSIPVFIRLSGKNLKAGMFLEAELAAANFEEVVSLPLEALTRNNQVHVIRDSTVVLQSVSPVNYESDQVWVKGLQSGESVIIEEIIQPIVGTKAISQS